MNQQNAQPAARWEEKLLPLFSSFSIAACLSQGKRQKKAEDGASKGGLVGSLVVDGPVRLRNLEIT